MRCLLCLLSAFFLTQPPALAMPPVIVIKWDTHAYEVELADTAAARELVKQLPLTLHASDLNANEKYGDLPAALPTAPRAVGRVHAGDLMLYTPTCLVLFYKDFSTPYRYTPVGRLKAPRELQQALGAGAVLLRLEAP